MDKDTWTAQLSVNPPHANVHIVYNLIKIAAQNEEMAMASCNECAGTCLGTTEAAAGRDRQKQDVKIVAAMVVALKASCLRISRILFKYKPGRP